MLVRTTSELLALRTHADPLADDALRALKRAPRPGENVLSRVEEGARDGVPALQRFLDETRALPSWADPRAYEAGRRAMTRHAPATFLVLLCGSLIESFAIAEGAAVLVRSGRLLKDAHARVHETASLVRDMLIPGGEQPGARAHTALLRVRLLHAAVRRFVGRGMDTGRLGVAVNQMDMAHTLLMFSLVGRRGVEELGAHLSDEERASWAALWRLGGHLIGVEPAVLPASLADEEHLYALVRAHYAPDDGSRALARSVLAAISRIPPFYLPDTALHVISRRLLGDELADRFQLQRSRGWSAAAAFAKGVVRAVDGASARVPFAHDVGVRAGWAFIETNRARVLKDMPEADYGFRFAK
jgi:hypothetical protein